MPLLELLECPGPGVVVASAELGGGPVCVAESGAAELGHGAAVW